MERLPKEEVQLDLFDDQMADLRQWLETTGIWRRILDESHQPTDAPPAQLDASCPGIAYEFDVRPEQEARFNTVVSVLGPMIQHLHKINPLVVASQLISSRPLVWVERYPDDEAMKRNIGPLCSRDYCVNDLEHRMRSTYVSGMRQISRLRRVVALGELSDATAAVVRGTVCNFGGGTAALPLLRLLPAAHPAWVNRLVHSGEAVAMHSLSANSAADTTAVPGASISYTVRDVDDGTIVALTAPFEYDVVAEFGADHAGRAIAVRPRHAPHATYICFRGVRRVASDRAHEADRRAMVANEMEHRPWIDDLSSGRQFRPADLQARAGVLGHHEAIYDGHAVDAPPSAALSAASLHAWLAQLDGFDASAASRGEIIFVGFSLGGALAQMTALRAAHELPKIAPRIRVLALGATQWASPELSTAYARIFGAQAVHLLTASPDGAERRAVGGTQTDASAERPPDSPSNPPSSSNASASRSLWTLGQATLVDPMTLGFTEQTSYTHNLILCEAPAGKAAAESAAQKAVERHAEGEVPTGGQQSLARRVVVGGGGSSSSMGTSGSGGGPTLRRRSAKTVTAAKANVERAAETTVAESVEARASSNVLALLDATTPSGPDGILKRRWPDLAHEHAYHSFWAGDLSAHHPFASDTNKLHTGRAYRGALIREHTRLRRWAGDETLDGALRAERGSGDSALIERSGSQLPLAMVIDGAWDCRAGVLYQVRHSQGGVSSFEAEPTPELMQPKIVAAPQPMKRLTSISSAMDELSMC